MEGIVRLTDCLVIEPFDPVDCYRSGIDHSVKVGRDGSATCFYLIFAGDDSLDRFLAEITEYRDRQRATEARHLAEAQPIRIDGAHAALDLDEPIISVLAD
jgi:hypothetical protein